MQLEDTFAYREARKVEYKEKAVAQRRAQIAVAMAISELTADPRWKVYGDHIEAIRQDYQRQANGYAQALLGNDFLEPRKYGQLKIEQAKAQGAAEALKQALEVAKVLIERGGEAKAEEDS